MTPIKKSFICEFRWIILTGLNIYFAIISHKSPKSFIRHVNSELRSTFMKLKSEIYRKTTKKKLCCFKRNDYLGLRFLGRTANKLHTASQFLIFLSYARSSRLSSSGFVKVKVIFITIIHEIAKFVGNLWVVLFRFSAKLLRSSRCVETMAKMSFNLSNWRTCANASSMTRFASDLEKCEKLVIELKFLWHNPTAVVFCQWLTCRTMQIRQFYKWNEQRKNKPWWGFLVRKAAR